MSVIPIGVGIGFGIDMTGSKAIHPKCPIDSDTDTDPQMVRTRPGVLPRRHAVRPEIIDLEIGPRYCYTSVRFCEREVRPTTGNRKLPNIIIGLRLRLGSMEPRSIL